MQQNTLKSGQLFVTSHFPDGNYCFQNDNAPVHRARLTKHPWMKTKQKPWNGRPKVRTRIPLKMYGWKLKLSCRKFQKTVDSMNQLYEICLQIWTNISVDYIRNVYSSIPKRMRKGKLEVTSLNIKVNQSSLYIFYILSLHKPRSWY